MRAFGDVLEAMVSCGDRWPTVHAELVHRYDPDTVAAARRSVGDAAGDGEGDSPVVPTAVPTPAPPWPGEEATGPVVRRGRLLAAGGMLRVEWPDEDEVTVVRDEVWRRRRGEDVDDPRPIGPGVPRPGGAGRPGVAARELMLVRPWLLLSWSRLRVVAPIQLGGRPSTRLAGAPRTGPRPPVFAGFADGAQRFDIVVDDETGLVVEIGAFYAGRLLERTSLRRLTIGDTADPRLFDLDALALGAPYTGPPGLDGPPGAVDGGRAPGGPAGPGGPGGPGATGGTGGTGGTGASEGPGGSGGGARSAAGPWPGGSAASIGHTPAVTDAGPDTVTDAAAGAVPGGGTGARLRPRPLAELVGEVDFPLCVPDGRRFLGRIEVRPEGPVVVAFSPGRGDDLLTFSQSRGAGIPETSGWERIRLSDGTIARWWPPEGEFVQGHLIFTRAGVRIWVRGVDRHAMTALAVRLRPPA